MERESREAQLERGAQIYNSKMRKDAINAISSEYPASEPKSFVPISEIRRIFNYLENYCKTLYDGKIPNNIFRGAAPCSIFQIRNKVMDFLRDNFYTYKQMTAKEIIISIYGEDKYNDALEKFAGSEKLSLELDHEEPDGVINGTMEDVDGGSKKKRKIKTRRINRKSKKIVRKRRKSRRIHH